MGLELAGLTLVGTNDIRHDLHLRQNQHRIARLLDGVDDILP